MRHSSTVKTLLLIANYPSTPSLLHLKLVMGCSGRAAGAQVLLGELSVAQGGFSDHQWDQLYAKCKTKPYNMKLQVNSDLCCGFCPSGVDSSSFSRHHKNPCFNFTP